MGANWVGCVALVLCDDVNRMSCRRGCGNKLVCWCGDLAIPMRGGGWRVGGGHVRGDIRSV